MTSKEIINQLIAIYNINLDEVNAQTKITILGQWLTKTFDENELDKIFYKVVENFTGTNLNPFPFIPDFNKHSNNNFEIETNATNAYNLISNKSNIYRDIIIENSYIQAGLDAVGGWIKFCNRSVSDEVWIKKDFLRGYVEAAKNKYKCDPKKYYGIGNNDKIIMIGDETNIKKYIEQTNNVSQILVTTNKQNIFK